MDFTSLAPVALFTFGAVNAVSIFIKLKSEQKIALAVIFAFGFGFIPADLGAEVANRIKDAVGVALATSAAAGIANRVGGK